MLLCALIFTAQGNVTDSGRVHQHETPVPDACSDHGGDTFCSHLPLILIETGGNPIPGDVIRDENSIRTGEYTTTEDGSSLLSVTVQILDEAGVNHHPTDAPSLTTRAQIRIRGNSSRSFEKKNYLLRPTTEDGSERVDLSLLGMDAYDEWALHGPYLDKSLIRNYMWYNIAGEIMDYAPNVRFCEVFLDGEYVGLYVLTETVNSGDNVRLGLTEMDLSSDMSSYVVRWDQGSSNEVKNITTLTNSILVNSSQVDIIYPGSKNLTQGRIEFIEQDISALEKALYSFDYNSKEYDIFDDIDIQSFADYWILTEFTCNYDAGYLSTYLYRDIRGKLKLCVWDYNSACNNFQDSIQASDSFRMQDVPWYSMLMKSEEFNQTVISRYRQLRGSYLNEDYLTQYMSDVITWLGPAIDRNYQVWSDSLEKDLFNLAERNPASHAEAVAQLGQFVQERGQWLDMHIESILQFSHPSKVKKYNH